MSTPILGVPGFSISLHWGFTWKTPGAGFARYCLARESHIAFGSKMGFSASKGKAVLAAETRGAFGPACLSVIYASYTRPCCWEILEMFLNLPDSRVQDIMGGKDPVGHLCQNLQSWVLKVRLLNPYLGTNLQVA